MPVPVQIKRSETESTINYRLIGIFVLGFLIVSVVGSYVWGFSPAPVSPEFSDLPVVQTFTPVVYAAPVVIHATPQPSPTPEVVQVVVTRQVVVTATDTPTMVPTVTPYYIYVSNDIEVTREVVVNVYPTPTIVFPGFVNLCVYGSGLTAIYIDGVGVAGDSCTLLPVGGINNDFHILVQR